MTYDEIATAALARVSELPGGVPQNRSVLYRRIGTRQHQLFQHAAAVNPDYFGVCVTGPLDGGACDLWVVAEDAPPVARVVRVEVAEPGASEYAPHQEIHVTSLSDPEAAFPPRCTLRDGVLRSVGSDLDGVLRVRVFYARSSREVKPTDGAASAELPAEWQELLVIDAARDLVRRALSPAADVKAALGELLKAEEDELLARFDAHLQEYAPVVSRFA